MIYRKGVIKFYLLDNDGKDRSVFPEPCFEHTLSDTDFFTEDHDTYIFMAAQSGTDTPNEHAIHNIRFYDIDHMIKDDFHDSKSEMLPFKKGKAVDQIRKGHVSM